MDSNNKAQDIKTLIFKEKKDYTKAKEAFFDEFRRRGGVSYHLEGKVENDFITVLHGEIKGFYDIVIMVPSHYLYRVEKSGINYHVLSNQEALQTLSPDSLNFLSGHKGGLEDLCK